MATSREICRKRRLTARALWAGSGTHRRDACATRFAVEYLLPQFRQRAAQTFGDERLRILPEPDGNGFTLQQIGDGGEFAKQS